MSIIKLQTTDGEVFETDVEVAKASHTLKTMMESLGIEEEDSVIPLPKIDSKTLKKVLEWATRHKDDPRPVDDPLVFRQQDVVLDEWDKEFFNVDTATLFDLMTAANYLDIKSLLDAACQTVANMVRGKSPEEIRAVMGVENDFSPEEEKRVRLENKWMDRE